MDRDSSFISKEAHELNYLLRKWGKRQTTANRARLIAALDAFGEATGNMHAHARQEFYAYAEQHRVADELEDRKPTQPSAAKPKDTPPVEAGGDLAARIDAILAALELTGLNVEIDEPEIERMSAGGVAIDYPAAVEAALRSFIDDDSMSESPLWIVKELAMDFGLDAPPSEAAAKAKVRELLRATGCWLRLYSEPVDPQDEWAGTVMCDHSGHRYDTSNYWIFTLEPSEFTDRNTAVVHKQTGTTINWGFS